MRLFRGCHFWLRPAATGPTCELQARKKLMICSFLKARSRVLVESDAAGREKPGALYFPTTTINQADSRLLRKLSSKLSLKCRKSS